MKKSSKRTSSIADRTVEFAGAMLSLTKLDGKLLHLGLTTEERNAAWALLLAPLARVMDIEEGDISLPA